MVLRESVPAEFDDLYIERLSRGDRAVEQHFATHFSRQLDRCLWSRLSNTAAVEDVRQETLYRVLAAVKRNPGNFTGNRLPLFVHGVCRRVLFEYWRKCARVAAEPEPDQEPDDHSDPEQKAFKAEKRRQLLAAIETLPSGTRRLITSVYFEEEDRSAVSRRFGVDRGYLRVLIHRALARLRTSLPEGRQAH